MSWPLACCDTGVLVDAGYDVDTAASMDLTALGGYAIVLKTSTQTSCACDASNVLRSGGMVCADGPRLPRTFRRSVSDPARRHAIIVAPMASMASLILLNSLLTNPSFEAGTVRRMSRWMAVHERIGVTTPAAGLYPDPNGLTPPAVVPDGTFAAFTPVTASNGILRQTIVGQTYAAGNTYTLDFWLGNPLGGIYPNRIDIQLLAGAFNSSQTNGLCDTAGRFATLVSGDRDLPGPQQITQVPEPQRRVCSGLAVASMGARFGAERNPSAFARAPRSRCGKASCTATARSWLKNLSPGDAFAVIQYICFVVMLKNGARGARGPLDRNKQCLHCQRVWTEAVCFLEASVPVKKPGPGEAADPTVVAPRVTPFRKLI